MLAALAALAVSTACRTEVAEPASREPAASASAPVATATAKSPCTLSVWADLAALRERPGVASIKDQVLKGLDARTLEMAQASGIDLERMSREAQLCELPGHGRSSRVLEFRGSYPPDMLDKLASQFAAVPQQDKAGIVRVSSGWLAAKEDRLLWSDDRAALEAGLHDELFDVPPRDAKLFAMRMSRERMRSVAPGKTRRTPLDDSRWTSVVVSTGRDGKSSEILFNTDSPESATNLLQFVQQFLDRTGAEKGSSKLLAPAQISADAIESSVALRAQLPPDDLLRVFTQLGTVAPKPASPS